jgi:hypothetical protein
MATTTEKGQTVLNQDAAAQSEINTWLGRLENAATDEERLFYLSRIQALDPHNRRAAQLMTQNMKGYLRKDPSLAYLEENQDLYRVRTGRDLILVVPKNRAVPETYSPERFGQFGQAYRSLMWAVLGLLLSGPIAIFFGVLSVLAAFRAGLLSQGSRAWARVFVIVLISLIILAPAVALTYLLWLHLVG